MPQTNTVSKINLRGRGFSLVWLNETPKLTDIEVENLLPSIPENLFGPNLGFSSSRISSNRYFLTTMSRWNVTDEFGREGLSLSQGNLVTLDPNDSDSAPFLYTSFLGLLRLHKLRYEVLGELLEAAARRGDNYQLERISSEIIKHSMQESEGFTVNLIDGLASFLETQIRGPEDRLRVYTVSPWSEDLGLCALLGLQIRKHAIKCVGGGYLGSFRSYDHISTSQNLSEFRYVDLSKVLNQRSTPASLQKGLWKAKVFTIALMVLSLGPLLALVGQLAITKMGVLNFQANRATTLSLLPLALFVWAVGPPVWLWFNHRFLFEGNDPVEFERFRYVQSQLRTIWLSIFILLLVVYSVKLC